MSDFLQYYRLRAGAFAPTFATKESACFDLYALIEEGNPVECHTDIGTLLKYPPKNDFFILYPGDRAKVPTGLVLDIPRGYSVRVHPRSGVAYKHGIILANSEGIIDSDYTDELFLLIVNTSDENFIIKSGMKLCQAEMVKDLEYSITETTDKPQQRTDRIGGFGSTGLISNK